MAILVLIATSLRPAVSALSGAANTTKAAYDLSAYYELARTEAVARNTYVWVGLANESSGANARLAVAMVASRDGTADSSAANFEFLARPLTFDSFRAATEAEARSANERVASAVEQMAGSEECDQISGQSEAIQFQAGSRTFSHTVTFTPQGDALLAGAPTPRSALPALLAVYVQKMHGSVGGRDQAAVVIRGPGGSVRVVRE